MSPAAKRITLLTLAAVLSGMGGLMNLVLAVTDAASAHTYAVAARPSPQTSAPPLPAGFGSAGEWILVSAVVHAVGAAVMITLAVMFARSIRRVRRELHEDGPYCTECGYSLRGLPEPRCPECGTTFEPMGEAP